MNKLFLTIALSLSFVFSVFAGDPKPAYVKKATAYAELCVKEFNVKDEAKEQIIKLKTQELTDRFDLAQKKKKGEITVEEMKTRIREQKKEYTSQLLKLLGNPTKQEFKAFSIKVKEEMRKNK